MPPRPPDPRLRAQAAARRRPPPRSSPPSEEEVDVVVRATLERATPPAPPNPATGRAVPDLGPGDPTDLLPEDPVEAARFLRQRRSGGPRRDA